MIFSPEQIAALKRGGKRVAVFYRLDTPEKVRLWSGVGDFKLPADAVETTDQARYRGVGLVDLPSIDMAINGKASRVEFGFSGVDEEIAQLADSEAPLVQGREVRLGILPLDEDWQPVWPVRRLFRGEADMPKSKRASSKAGVSYTVSVSVGSRFTGRRQGREMLYTPTDQALDVSGDQAFDNVSALNEGTEKKWPRG